MARDKARFLVPVRAGQVDVPEGIKILDADIRGSYAEILVEGSCAKYLRERRYAQEVELPRKHVSLSQISTYMRCPLLYYWQYETEFKRPFPSAITFGSATHKTLEINYKQKIDTNQDLPVDALQEVFSYEFDRMVDKTDWEEGEEPGAVKDEGINLIPVYMQQIAPKTQPIAVERAFDVELEDAEFTLRGVIDLVTDQGVIVDTKTSKRSPNQDVIVGNLQMIIYSVAHRQLFGEPERGLRMDYLVRTKTPKTVTLEADPSTDHDIKRMLRTLNVVARGIRSKLYYPNPGSFMCSPKGCGYYDICQEGW